MDQENPQDPPETLSRSHIVAKLQAAKDEVKQLTRFLEIFDELGGAEAHPSRRLSGGKATAATEAVAEPIIRSMGPQSTTNLVRLLKENGHDIGGREPRAKLHSRLSRARSLKMVRGVGWSLKDDPARQNEPPAGVIL